MKIIITAASSYIGNAVAKRLVEELPNASIIRQSLRNVHLDLLDWHDSDVIFHVSGIAHNSNGNANKVMYDLINRDLAIKVAIKAKLEGVKHFIFASSMAIFGKDQPIDCLKPINTNRYNFNNAYGRTKREAEIAIKELQSDHFKVAIFRFPMVYGPNSKGNFPKLEKLASKLGFFPKIHNQRSILHIENLCTLISFHVQHPTSGIFYPQDTLYFNTTSFVESYRNHFNKRTIFIPGFYWIFMLLTRSLPIIRKLYGNKFYSQTLNKGMPESMFNFTWKTYLEKL